MPSRPVFAPAVSPPHSRYRDHSPTKSSPLRHAVSTRSNNSDTDDGLRFARQDLKSRNVSSTCGRDSFSNCDKAGDPFVTPAPSALRGKRERSESPVKTNSAFAKWQAREQTEQNLPSLLQEHTNLSPSKMNISPKKIKDDDWRRNLGGTESRSALRNMEPNAVPSAPSPYDITMAADAEATFGSEREMSARSIVDNHKRIESPGRPATAPAKPQTTQQSPPRSPEHTHKLSPQSNAVSNASTRLSRTDSMRASTRPRHAGHARFSSVDGSQSTPSLDNSELLSLSNSSTPYLKTLGGLSSASTDELTIHRPEEQVAGLAGRRRLQRSGSVRPTSQKESAFASQFSSIRWMDAQRKYLQAYEYLCHIGEARAWLEDVLEPVKLPPIVQLEEALRDGVTLAEVVVCLAPRLQIHQQRRLGSLRIFKSARLQFRHSDNIALFFRFLAEVELPELFRFELVDLYEKKNIPKVIYCIHALSWLLFRKDLVDFRIGNLVGQLQFEEHELEEAQKGIDRSGVAMPNFGGMREAMQVEEEPPEPTLEEQLAGEEGFILDLQSQIRGMTVRLQLGEMMNHFWDAEDGIAELQAFIRAGFSRELFAFRYDMKTSTAKFQATAKAFLVRNRRREKARYLSKNVDAVVIVQSLWRGRQQRAETRQIKMRLRSDRHGTSELQAAIRGALGRWRAGDVWNDVQDSAPLVVDIQAAIRGALERTQISRVMNDLWDSEDSITALQSFIRASQLRRNACDRRSEVRAAALEIVHIQGAVRGLLQRRQQNQRHGELKIQENVVRNLQSACRGVLTRLKQARIHGGLQAREKHIIKMQAAFRAYGQRRTTKQLQNDLCTASGNLIKLQSIARASVLRDQVRQLRTHLARQTSTICSFQALGRAMLERGRIGQQLATLEDSEETILEVQSIARAYLTRQRVLKLLVELENEDASTYQIHALCRGLLTRSHVGQILSELEECEAEILELQAVSRAFIVRAQFAEKKRHYYENMQKVIKLQSFVRAKQQGESYKSLVSGKNPPLPVVRKHIHLLTDSTLEFEGELEAERLRRQVVENVRRNELVEGYVEGLDVKIALLVKNKITLDEVVRHQKHFGGSASQLLRSGSTNSGSIDLKALNKSSRKKLQGYEELFFTLQTQPLYLSRLLQKLMQTGGIPEKEGKNFERLMMTLFGYAQKTREEYFLLRLLAESSCLVVQRSGSLDDSIRQLLGSFHQRLFLSYVRSPRDRAYLKILLGGLVRDGIVGQEHLDLESDPLQIHRAILNDEELRTGIQSQQSRDIPREQAIRLPAVKQKFVENLQDLRDLCDNFFVSLEESVHRMPYGVRFMASQQYAALLQQYPREDAGLLSQPVGNWLWRSYFLPALREPEIWGVIDRGLSHAHRRNLSQVVTVLGQVVAGRLFSNENLYLQPLNNWVSESLTRWQDCLHHIFEVPAPEEHFDADQWSDLYSRTKPTLYMKLPDIFAIHSLVASNLSAIAPARDDPIKELLSDLGTAKGNESDFAGGYSNTGEITLTLKSRFTVQEDPNVQWRQLFTATKRLVLHIIKVQSGNNLMEILLRPVTEEDVDRWEALLREEIAENDRSRRRPHYRTGSINPKASMRGGRTQSVYSEAPSTVLSEDCRDLLDLQGMSYSELKGSAIENIIALENPQVPAQYRVSRHNNYQEILNALAADIRQKHRRRLERQQEVDSTRATIHQLDAKASFLEDQLKSYNDYIEQCLHTLASKKGSKNKFVMPFTKQWTHERELKMAGRQPKFGSYKYSARQLADKGVLLQWAAYPLEQWGQIHVIISSDEVGVFHVEASSGSMMLPGGAGNILLDDLLQAQYDNKQTISVFEEAGNGASAKLAVNLLLHLVFKKFYRDE